MVSSNDSLASAPNPSALSPSQNMSITGNLRTLELSELLQWLAQGTKTGVLIIENADTEKRIYFDRGTIVSSESSDSQEHLGHFLIEEGLIDEPTLARALKLQQATQILLGKVLVTLGAITEKDLSQVLQQKTQETIYELFGWPEGEFRFVPDDLPEFPMVPMALDVTNIVLEGMAFSVFEMSQAANRGINPKFANTCPGSPLASTSCRKNSGSSTALIISFSASSIRFMAQYISAAFKVTKCT